ncbi:hypothetical protein [Escherichia coli]|uniref:hypothetical protein n=1 Tax=Escherichia coli TaxID=562 RepID=UPI0020A6929E|nr:hypothetical protein [Escherichia coli]
MSDRGKLNLGGCVIEVMGTHEATTIVRVTIGEYGATGFINGTVCNTCTVLRRHTVFPLAGGLQHKNKPDTVSQRDASTTQKGAVTVKR